MGFFDKFKKKKTPPPKVSDRVEIEQVTFEPAPAQEPNPEPKQEQKPAKWSAKRGFPELLGGDEETGDAHLKYSYDDVHVVGAKYHNVDYSKLKKYTSIDLMPEPKNEHDPEAIMVGTSTFKDGFNCIGYMQVGKIRDMVRDYKKDKNDNRVVIAHLESVDEESQQISIELGFYLVDEPKKKKRGKKTISEDDYDDYDKYLDAVDRQIENEING